MKKIFITTFLLFLSILYTKTYSAELNIKAKSVILQDHLSGEILYEKLKSASKVMLDCKNQEIIILENNKNDEMVEVRKTLKLLGYIR